jgi:ribosomal protein L24
LSGQQKEVELQLQDIEHVFQIGDTVQVVAGSCLGVEGHIIQMLDDVFCLCQDISKEEASVSFHFSILQNHLTKPIGGSFKVLSRLLPSEPHVASMTTNAATFKPPPDVESIQMGGYIEVLFGKHIGKCGIVHWLPKGADSLWFQDRTLNLPVPISFIQWTHLPHLQTLQCMKDRVYNIKSGDVVRVVCGLEYLMKGVIRSIDFPKACLTLLSDIDH